MSDLERQIVDLRARVADLENGYKSWDAPVVLCVVARTAAGEINREPYYSKGFWARPDDWLWRHAVDKAMAEAVRTRRPIHIQYGDGEIVGGVVPE